MRMTGMDKRGGEGRGGTLRYLTTTLCGYDNEKSSTQKSNKMPVWKHPSSPLRENFVSIGMKVFFFKDSTVSYLLYTLLETKSKLQIKIALL